MGHGNRQILTFPLAFSMISSSPFVQLAYFVEDIEQAAAYWVEKFSAGPFFVAQNIALDSVVYKGSPAVLDHSSAYGQYGSMMLELVQVNSRQDSIFTGAEYGLHHMARFAQNLEQELQAYQQAGFNTVMKASVQDMTFAFVDTRQSLGHYTELYQDCELIRGFYHSVKEAATDWDGKTPLRSL